MNKTIIVILILVIIALGGYFLLRTPEVQAPGDEVSETPISEMPIQNTETPETLVVPTSPTDSSSSVGQNIITYSDTGYSPNTLKIKTGDTVTWTNDSSSNMWPASAMHPTHAVYPTTGGCLGSTFDACKGVQPGESWSFKFDEIGTWKYHDHLKPSVFGTIVVE